MLVLLPHRRGQKCMILRGRRGFTRVRLRSRSCRGLLLPWGRRSIYSPHRRGALDRFQLRLRYRHRFPIRLSLRSPFRLLMRLLRITGLLLLRLLLGRRLQHIRLRRILRGRVLRIGVTNNLLLVGILRGVRLACWVFLLRCCGLLVWRRRRRRRRRLRRVVGTVAEPRRVTVG